MSKRKGIPNVMDQLQGLGEAPEPKTTPASIAPPRTSQLKSTSARNTNKTPKSRLVGRVTYDIGQDLKNAIHQESIDLGVPASQLAKYLLLYAWDFYVKEEIPSPELQRSDSPKFRNTIDFGE